MKRLIPIVLALCLFFTCPGLPTEAQSTVDPSEITVSVNSEISTSPLKNAFDGNLSTFWHSNFTAEGSSIISHDTPPFFIYMTLPSPTPVSGMTYTPRNDTNMTGTLLQYQVYASADGQEPAYLIAEGNTGLTPADPGKTYTIDFGKSYQAKTFILRFVTAFSGYGSAAEIALLQGSGAASPIAVTKETLPPTLSGAEAAAPDVSQTPTPTKKTIDRTGASITGNSIRAEYRYASMLDGDKSTYWHSNYTNDGKTITGHDNPPYRLTMTLASPSVISGLLYTPRQDQGTGRFLNYTVYGLDDLGGKEYKLSEGEFANSPDDQVVDFGSNVRVRAVILETTSTQGGYGTCAELNLLAPRDDYDTDEAASSFGKSYLPNKSYVIAKDGWTAIANSFWSDTYTGAAAIDGKTNTIWHTLPSDKANYPFTLEIDMEKTHTLTGVDIVPRYNDEQGYWQSFAFYGSLDGQTYDLIDGDFSFPDAYRQDLKAVRHIDFSDRPDVRYIRVEVNKSFNGHCAVGELSFYETGESAQKNDVDTSESYTLVLGKNTIDVVKAGEESTVTLDVAPYIDNARTLIPLRGLLEAMGAEIAWDGETQTIVIKKDRTEITLQIINNLVYVYKYYGGEYKTIRYTLDVPPKIRNDRTFLPLRFVSEHLGYNVSWDGETQSIIIERE